MTDHPSAGGVKNPPEGGRGHPPHKPTVGKRPAMRWPACSGNRFGRAVDRADVLVTELSHWGRSTLDLLQEQLTKLQAKAQARTGKTFPIIVIQEAGLDGFWMHRVLEREGIESHVVDAASILISRRRRRAKTDRNRWRGAAADTPGPH